MNERLTIAVRRERGSVVVAVTGEIDISTVSELRESLFEQADNGSDVIVDLDRISFIDSAGLGALVGASRRAEASGGSLHAVCGQPHTKKLLWLTGVDRRIPLDESLEEALASVASAKDPSAN